MGTDQLIAETNHKQQDCTERAGVELPSGQSLELRVYAGPR